MSSPPAVREQIAAAAFAVIPVDVANAKHLTNDIELFFYQGLCTLEVALRNACAQLARTTTSAKPQKLVIPSLPPGMYTVSVTNFGPNDESGTMTAFLIH